VQGYTRRQLKQDRFVETTQEAVHWASGHQRPVIWAIVAIIIAAAAFFGITAWIDRQNEQANAGLSVALRAMSEPLRPADAPAGQGPGYATAAERAKAAEKQFQDLGNKFSYTRAGKVARYLQGVTAIQAGDNDGAEQQLKSVADSRDKDVAALAKLALASLYRSTNRPTDAVRLYKDLQQHPTTTVSKSEAELEMAEMYEKTDPTQAMNIYQQIQKEDPVGPAAQIASARLAAVK
jgi:predicted negative regulator of RcsB-dependent stress response